MADALKCILANNYFAFLIRVSDGFYYLFVLFAIVRKPNGFTSLSSLDDVAIGLRQCGV